MIGRFFRSAPASLFLCLALAAPLRAEYRFAVPSMDLQVYVLRDASARIEYRIEFQNMPDAQAIDVVDIGLPHLNYDLAKMSAQIDGHELSNIQPSTYVSGAVEIPLGPHQIGPGQTKTLTFSATMPDMVYADTTDKQYASLQIRPTWFDPQLMVGTTHLRVAIHLQPAVTVDEVKYQEERTKYKSLYVFGEEPEKHVVAFWEFADHRLSENNPKISISFSRRGLDRVVQMSAWQLLRKWLYQNPQILWGSGLGLMIALAFLFFRFSHGTGGVVFVFLAGLLVFALVIDVLLHFVFWPVIIGLTIWNERVLRKRPLTKYLPAMATVEGGGIKRGLTAPQAAVILELPLSKVLMLVVFGLLKKNVARMVSAKPPTLEIDQAFHGDPVQRRKESAERGIVLHDYEHPFLDRLQKSPGPIQKVDLSGPIGELIMSVGERMKGFDLSDTKDYYRRIVERAIQEASSVGEIPTQEVAERNMEWILIDPDWTEVFDDWDRRGYPYRPRWIIVEESSPPVSGTGGTSGSNLPRGSKEGTSQTTIGEVAGSFAGWMENFSGQLASAIEPAKLGIPLPKGVVDLSGVDKVTADVFKAIAESSSKGGGGGGGGCACACAGCACACACAGGGR